MSGSERKILYTVGHSNHAAQAFLGLLTMHGINAVADVRSTPYSRYSPQFDRETLRVLLREANIAYVYLGDELGARSDDPSCYLRGKVQFERLARTPKFQAGLARVRRGAADHQLALMCAEKEPLDCHRTILVSRHLVASGLELAHIHADGRIETHSAAIDRLMTGLRLRHDEFHLFRSEADRLDDAYRMQEERVAYTLQAGEPGGLG